LFDTQGTMPYPELIECCDVLLADLHRLDESQFSSLFKLIRFTESIRNLACIANGDTSLDFWLYFLDSSSPSDNWKPAPRCIRLLWNKEQPALDTATPWVTNDMHFVPLTVEEKMQEAQAAILFNGRGDFSMVAWDEWLDKYPRSLTLTCMTIQALHVLDAAQGLPIQHSLDGKAEMASYMRQIQYVSDNIQFWLKRIEAVPKLNKMDDYIRRFVTPLNARPLIENFPDQQYDDLHKQLAEWFKEADQRVGRNRSSSGSQQRFVPWQAITRELVHKQNAHHLLDVPAKVVDRDYLFKQIEKVETSTVAQPDISHFVAWWNVLRGDEMDCVFTFPEIAEFCSRLHKQALALTEAEDLSGMELRYLCEQAVTMLRGGYVREAEELFEKIQKAPVNDLNRGSSYNGIQANVAYRLAHIYRMNRRLPEAMEQAKLGLQLCQGGTFVVISGSGRNHDSWGQARAEIGFKGALAEYLLNLLQDLRRDPQRVNLPPRVNVVTVPTPNIENPEVKFFYRMPLAADGNRPYRALILGAGTNAEILSYFQADGDWVRFADKYNLVLIMPQFRATSTNQYWTKGDVYSYYGFAQVWSGQALLDGLDKIAEQCAIPEDHLLFYAYGTDGGYALRFARWRPDLVAAVAVGRPSKYGTPRFAEPELRPMSELKDTAIYIGASEFDDERKKANRYGVAVHFATLLQAADAPVEWKNYPDLTPPTAQELESDAREFLAKQLTKE